MKWTMRSKSATACIYLLLTYGATLDAFSSFNTVQKNFSPISMVSSNRDIEEARSMAMNEDKEWFEKFIKYDHTSFEGGEEYLSEIPLNFERKTEDAKSSHRDKGEKSSLLTSDDEESDFVEEYGESADRVNIEDSDIFGESYLQLKSMDESAEMNHSHEASTSFSSNFSTDKIEKREAGSNQSSTHLSPSELNVNGDNDSILTSKDIDLLKSLGYSKADIDSVAQDTLSMIVERKIKKPSDGIPADWKNISASDLMREFRRNSRKRDEDSEIYNESQPRKKFRMTDKRNRKSTNTGYRRISRREEPDVDDEYEYAREPVSDKLDRFKKMLRKESMMRLGIIGPAFSGAVAAENRMRIGAYRDWLNFLYDENIDAFPEKNRSQRKQPSSNERYSTAAKDYASDDEDDSEILTQIGKDVADLFNEGIKAAKETYSEFEENRRIEAEAWEDELSGKNDIRKQTRDKRDAIGKIPSDESSRSATEQGAQALSGSRASRGSSLSPIRQEARPDVVYHSDDEL